MCFIIVMIQTLMLGASGSQLSVDEINSMLETKFKISEPSPCDFVPFLLDLGSEFQDLCKQALALFEKLRPEGGREGAEGLQARELRRPTDPSHEAYDVFSQIDEIIIENVQQALQDRRVTTKEHDFQKVDYAAGSFIRRYRGVFFPWHADATQLRTYFPDSPTVACSVELRYGSSSFQMSWSPYEVTPASDSSDACIPYNIDKDSDYQKAEQTAFEVPQPQFSVLVFDAYKVHRVWERSGFLKSALPPRISKCLCLKLVEPEADAAE